MFAWFTLAMGLLLASDAQARLAPGDHIRRIMVDGLERTARIHIPVREDLARPLPVVLAFHGSMMTAAMMESYTGLDGKADAAGFVVVYPQAAGAGLFRSFNVGGVTGRIAETLPDDLAFVDLLLEDLEAIVPVDPDRVYATGISNGGMFCYRLAALRANRIAAIAPVAGVATCAHPAPSRPVPILHIHGTDDRLVLYENADKGAWNFVSLLSVRETIAAWVAADGCPSEPTRTEWPDRDGDGNHVTRASYGPGREGSEVVLLTVHGGGHTWPGATGFGVVFGRTSRDFNANDVIWEFFQAHPRRPAVVVKTSSPPPDFHP